MPRQQLRRKFGWRQWFAKIQDGYAAGHFESAKDPVTAKAEFHKCQQAVALVSWFSTKYGSAVPFAEFSAGESARAYHTSDGPNYVFASPFLAIPYRSPYR